MSLALKKLQLINLFIEGKDMTTKYVHDGKEVILTGRTAAKKLRSGKEQILYEVQPEGVLSKQYNKWVLMKDLFEIQQNEELPTKEE